MSTENQESASLPPELNNFFQDRLNQAAEVAQRVGRAIPNNVIKGDGTRVDASRKTVAAPPQNMQSKPEPVKVTEPVPQADILQTPVKPVDQNEDPFDFSDPDPAPAPAQKEEGIVDPDSEDMPAEPDFAKNFKKFRETVRAAKKAEKEALTRAQAAELKNKEYEEGAHIPTVLQEKENEIARLSTYEKLHSLKTSKEYKQKFVEPMNALTTQLEQIAKDYEVPENVLAQALDITNKRDLNHFLSSHFDEAGTGEVRQLFDKIKNIQTEAKAAELQPARVLQELRDESAAIETQQTAIRYGKISEKAKHAWVKSLTKIRQEGKFPELISRETDPVHTAHMQRIVSSAATEYSKAVRVLAQNGLQELPDDVAEMLSNLTLLAHSSAINAQSRDRYAEEAERLQQENANINQYIRPVPGRGTTQGGTPEAKAKPISNEQAAAQALRKVGVQI